MISYNTKHTHTKGTLFLIVISCYFALVSLVFGAGIGKSINIYEKTMYVLLSFSLFFFVANIKKLFIHINWLFVIFLIITQSIICYLQSGMTYLDYLRIFLIFVPYSLFPIYEKSLTYISLVYGVFGMAILLAANFTSLFNGWDGNSISLNAFFSYVVFIISFSNTKKGKTLMSLVLYSIIYFLLLTKFNSRSTILFSIFLFLCILSLIPLKKFLNKTWLIIFLLVPLFIALFIILIKDTSFVDKLNVWSLHNTDKPIFNGRDKLWDSGINQWLKHPLFGTGNVNYTAHNSAVTCLVGGGIIGYSVLIFSIYSLLKKGLVWIEDNTSFGLIAAFLTIWLQQSVELGLIASTVNPIPYLILALLYSRIKTLEKNNEQKNSFVEYNNPCI